MMSRMVMRSQTRLPPKNLTLKRPLRNPRKAMLRTRATVVNAAAAKAFAISHHGPQWAAVKIAAVTEGDEVLLVTTAGKIQRLRVTISTKSAGTRKACGSCDSTRTTKSPRSPASPRTWSTKPHRQLLRQTPNRRLNSHWELSLHCAMRLYSSGQATENPVCAHTRLVRALTTRLSTSHHVPTTGMCFAVISDGNWYAA